MGGVILGTCILVETHIKLWWSLNQQSKFISFLNLVGLETKQTSIEDPFTTLKHVIETEAKMSATWQTPFSLPFFEYGNCCILIPVSVRFVPDGSIYNTSALVTGVDNGLTPNRHQAIIWTNDGIVHWHNCLSIGVDGLKATIAFKRITLHPDLVDIWAHVD